MGVTIAGWQQELIDTLHLRGMLTATCLSDGSNLTSPDAAIEPASQPVIQLGSDPAMLVGAGLVDLSSGPLMSPGSGAVHLSSDLVMPPGSGAVHFSSSPVAFRSSPAFLLRFAESSKLVLHLIPIAHHFIPADLLKLQENFQANGQQLIQLWEDVWRKRPAQVLSRIAAMLGKNNTIHGRKTKVIPVTQVEADRFFGQYHLQFSAKARHRFALHQDGEVVAMASFSAKRNMTRKREGYTSVELIRFATVDGITVQGGLSKLIRHMIKTISPDDVMTYADLDWSHGKGYTKLGFELTAQTPPAEIWINKETLVRYFPQRLPENIQGLIANLAPQEASGVMEPLGYRLIYNTGNLKYILYLSAE